MTINGTYFNTINPFARGILTRLTIHRQLEKARIDEYIKTGVFRKWNSSAEH